MADIDAEEVTTDIRDYISRLLGAGAESPATHHRLLGGAVTSGTAVDLQYASAAAKAWAHANAAKFGLRFSISWEPWHIEPLSARG